MSIIVRLIHDKQKELVEIDAKKEKRENLALELAILDKEISDFDENQIRQDIEELKDCAVKLGLIPCEIQEETQECNTLDTESI